jgi:DNA-binding NarL/FixJ family response regulator
MEQPEMPVRILLADDDDLVRTALRMILESEPDFTIVGEASNGAQALDMALRVKPDIVLMDIQMPEMDGIAATKRLVESVAADGPRVVVLTTFELDQYVFEALRAGASGFLLKRTPADELINGIKVVAGGEALLSPSVTRRLIREFVKRPSSTPDRSVAQRLDTLTERELEVLTLVAQGLSNGEIAGRIFVSEGTVKTHVRRVFSKLDVRDRTQAVIFAYNVGLVRPEGAG